MPTKFPTVNDVAYELRELNKQAHGEADVRLQVLDDGNWWVHLGDASHDLDHHGFWGAGTIPGCGGKHGKPRKFNSKLLAEDLINQAADHYAQDKE